MIAFNKYYNHFNIVSTFLIVVSLVLLIFKGLNFGIDFKGGTLIELRSTDEKNNIVAFDSGYTKSRTAIIDANITTLLAAVILFFMGSGPVKGFSVTLGVGIFTTLFSVYFIARLFTSIYVSRNRNKERLI